MYKGTSVPFFMSIPRVKYKLKIFICFVVVDLALNMAYIWLV